LQKVNKSTEIEIETSDRTTTTHLEFQTSQIERSQPALSSLDASATFRPGGRISALAACGNCRDDCG
jgi:hypothetical protein